VDRLQTIYEGSVAMLRCGHPAWVVAAIALLPLCGVPVIPLIVLAGARLGPVIGSLATCGALSVNVAIGYGLAAKWLRRPIERLLAARGHRIPTLASEDETKFILLCRLTPGVPLTVQNYLLGGARVQFGRYLLLSLPIQWAWGVAFVVFGNSLTRSSLWRVLLAGCLVVAVGLLIGLARKWFKTRSWGATPTGQPPAT
jgi:uncharacterized membrane protein YdjX (TVP38/TMEM64 family)